jgi:hypothetical protein
MEKFDELLDEAFVSFSGRYTLSGYNTDRVAGLLAYDILDEYSETLSQIIKDGITARFAALTDVLREGVID